MNSLFFCDLFVLFCSSGIFCLLFVVVGFVFVCFERERACSWVDREVRRNWEELEEEKE